MKALLHLSLAAAAFVSSTVFAQEKEKKPPPPDPPPIPKYPEPESVLASMKMATAFFRSNLSVAGGYAWSWPRDLNSGNGEHGDAPTLIAIQPPGTPTVGLAMLEAYRETGDPLFLQGAKEAAHALMWCQYASGGWGAEYRFDLKTARRYHYRRDIDAGDLNPGKRKCQSSIDDNKTQSAIRFLLELANTPACSDDTALGHALKFAWDALLAAQAPNGGWPQQFSGDADPDLPLKKAKFPIGWPREFPDADYTGHYTLNDNNILHVMELLLRAHEIEKAEDSRYLKAAKRLGDFLLLAQLPDPQPVWAQQYDREMHPAWARKFEPPAACSAESLGAMKALLQLWLATGEKKYIATLPTALEWFERSELGGGVWARFYELKTNKPLYCKAGTYGLTYEDGDLPDHYGFKLSGKLGESLERIRERLNKGREEILSQMEREKPDSEKEWSNRARKLASKARVALKEQKKEGYWMKGEFVDAGEFVKHLTNLTAYLNAAEKGGHTFTSLREKERHKEDEKSKSPPNRESDQPVKAETP